MKSSHDVRPVWLAASADERLGQWSDAAQGWAALARLDPGHADPWREARVRALVLGDRWTDACAAFAERATARVTAGSLLGQLMFLIEHAVISAAPGAGGASRCAYEAWVSAGIEPADRPEAARLDAILRCTEGDRAGAIDRLTTLTSTRSDRPWVDGTRAELERLRAGGPCVPVGFAPHRDPQYHPWIRRRVLRRVPRALACYERRIVEAPDVAGAMTLRFVVTTDGDVLEASLVRNTVDDPELEACILGTVVPAEFPIARASRVEIVEHPLFLCAPPVSRRAVPVRRGGR